MTDQEELDAHEQALEQLRNYVASLRSERRRLEEQREQVERRSEAIGTDLVEAEAALKNLAKTRAPQLPKRAPAEPASSARRPPIPMERARDAMQRMGEITIPGLAALLDTNVSTARRLITQAATQPFGQDGKPFLRETDRMAPPTGGHGRKSKVYEFVRPEPNGHAPHSRPRGAPEIELRRRGATPAPTGRNLKVRKDVRELLKIAGDSGYQPERTKNGHIRLVNPQTGDMHIIAGSDSDHRAAKNAKARIKRGGPAAAVA